MGQLFWVDQVGLAGPISLSVSRQMVELDPLSGVCGKEMLQEQQPDGSECAPDGLMQDCSGLKFSFSDPVVVELPVDVVRWWS